MKRYEFTIRGAITALAAFGALAIGPAVNAQSVTVNNAQVCVSAPSLSMDPAGNLNIICTPAGGGGPTIPSCVVTSATVQVGATGTISASCSGGAITVFAWTNTGTSLAPGYTATNTASQQVSGPFATAMIGTVYSFSMTATNSAGTSPAATGTLTVIAPVVTGTCPTVALSGGSSTFTDTYGQATLSIPRGGIAAIALPPWVAAAANHAYYQFDSAQVTGTQNDLGTQISISTCPGDFTSNPAPCRTWGVANTGSTTIHGNAGAGNPAYCYMATGTQYYLNVRNVGQDGVTPSCNVSSCGVIMQMHTGYY
jgi:large repetitive protein